MILHVVVNVLCEVTGILFVFVKFLDRDDLVISVELVIRLVLIINTFVRMTGGFSEMSYFRRRVQFLS